MVVVPLTQPEKQSKIQRISSAVEGTNWARAAAGGSLLAGGLLLLTGNKKAALVAAASGTTLAMLDQQETVKAWWNALPVYVELAQHALGKVEEGVAEVAAQRERLHRILTR